MKRTADRGTAAGELSAVLDASIADKRAAAAAAAAAAVIPTADSVSPPNGLAADLLDDEAIARLADEQERSRRAFDAVLEKSSHEWQAVHDPTLLANALVTVLDQIRGPALARVGQNAAVSSGGVEQGGERTSAKGRVGEARGVTVTDGEEGNGVDVAMNEFADVSDVSLGEAESARETFVVRAKYIPLRLSQGERKVLRLVEAALNVSEYTDVVDVLTYSRMKTKQRVHAQIRDLCSVLTGLAVASDYTRGQELVAGRDFAENEAFFQTAFEVARRHKVANPEKSRETYGKLIHMLQDSVTEEITRLLEFSCVKPLVTVASHLEDRGGLELLEDPLVHIATREIIAEGKSRKAVQKEIAQKERAVKVLAKRYKNGRKLGEEEIERCLYSIGDNNAYLRCARDPCDTMIKFLHHYFKPERPANRENSLSISDGVGGARLTHDHRRQFRYVFQSLALWREICHDMYKLWYLSEKDLLNSANSYHLRNTGQGLNRVQAAPNVSKAMYEILNTVQRRVGSWVGSSVVHLGDYNVPNALTFIDKYAQVQRILGPLCTCIRRIGEVVSRDEHMKKYVNETFGGVEAARKLILRDFFRHAFDGSGASDWFSAGSCIDGRLTSAWNWCSDVEKKSYWSLFLITGFSGFDGAF